MKSVSELLFAVLFLMLSCTSNESNDVNKLIHYFMSNPEQLENFKQLQISPRGVDTFIYGIDSLQLGLYLIGFDRNNKSALKISYLPDSLLKAKGIKNINNFKQNIVELAFDNLCIMDELHIKVVNSCSQKENCCIKFKLYDESLITYFCEPFENLDEIKKVYGENVNSVENHWLYSLDDNK